MLARGWIFRVDGRERPQSVAQLAGVVAETMALSVAGVAWLCGRQFANQSQDLVSSRFVVISRRMAQQCRVLKEASREGDRRPKCAAGDNGEAYAASDTGIAATVR
jgi:hypothetical protein